MIDMLEKYDAAHVAAYDVIFANQTYHCDPDLHQLHRQLWRKRWELGVGISQCHTRSEHGPHQRWATRWTRSLTIATQASRAHSCNPGSGLGTDLIVVKDDVEQWYGLWSGYDVEHSVSRVSVVSCATQNTHVFIFWLHDNDVEDASHSHARDPNLIRS